MGPFCSQRYFDNSESPFSRTAKARNVAIIPHNLSRFNSKPTGRSYLSPKKCNYAGQNLLAANSLKNEPAT